MNNHLFFAFVGAFLTGLFLRRRHDEDPPQGWTTVGLALSMLLMISNSVVWLSNRGVI